MPAVQRADDLTAGHVQRGEQRGGASPDVVGGLTLGHARHHRQHRLGPVQGLDPALLIHAEHQSPLGRVEVEPDHVVDLVDEVRVGGELERLDPVRLEAEGAPDPRDRGLRQAGLSGHRPRRPVRRALRRALERSRDQRGNLPVGHRARTPGTRHVPEPGDPVLDEPRTPPTHRVRRRTQLLGDILIRRPGRALQDDPATQRPGLRCRAAPHPTLQRRPLVIAQHQLGLRPPHLSHTPSLHLCAELMTQDTRDTPISARRDQAPAGAHTSGRSY